MIIRVANAAACMYRMFQIILGKCLSRCHMCGPLLWEIHYVQELLTDPSLPSPAPSIVQLNLNLISNVTVPFEISDRRGHRSSIKQRDSLDISLLVWISLIGLPSIYIYIYICHRCSLFIALPLPGYNF